MIPQRLSIEVTNLCQKGCSFCYNASGAGGSTSWTTASLLDFVLDCQGTGTEAVSFGGGEPLLFDGLFDVLEELKGSIFRSITTNGIQLDDQITYRALLKSEPDKVHVSIHDPENQKEVDQVICQVKKLDRDGITSGINLLIHQSSLPAGLQVAENIHQAGISSERVIFIPLHGDDSPTPEEVANTAGGQPFQSVSCLQECRIRERFCAVGWDQKVGWCSYTSSRKELPELSAAGLEKALKDLPLTSCETHLPRL